RGITGHSRLYQAMGVSTARRGWRHAGAPPDASEVERSITINKPVDELYRLWREPGNVALIMGHFAEITPVSDSRLHWVMRAAPGRTVQWETELVEDREGELLRWHSLPGAGLPNEGTVRFYPGREGWGSVV